MEQQPGFRITRQRRIILDQLRMLKTHPTASELYESVRRKLPNISLGTVYRNLEILSERGLIAKIVTNGRQMRFDGNLESHYHARCMRCGMIEDVAVDEEVLSLLRKEPGAGNRFRVVDARIELVGLCGDCIAEGEG